MSRNILRAALALTVAGGVYLAAQPVEASNMGFKLERSLDVIRDPLNNRTRPNIYFVAFPLHNGLGDVANTGHAGTNKCVGDMTGPIGPAAGDGIINIDDIVCDLWTSRQGVFQVSFINSETCSRAARIAQNSPPFGIQFLPGATDVLDREIGYQINVGVPGASMASPQNRAVIVGSHDPSYTGKSIDAGGPGCGAGAPRQDLVNLPYHTMYRTANELLCGLENVDWIDVVNPIGNPDTCPNGTDPANAGIPFDGDHPLQVSTFDNEVDFGYKFRTVDFGPPFGLTFGGNLNFQLRPGDAYLFTMHPQHVPTTFLSPHF